MRDFRKNFFVLLITLILIIGAATYAYSSIWTATSNPSNYYDYPTSIEADSSNIYAAGFFNVKYRGEDNTPDGWRLEKRSLADGSLINSFGINGTVVNQSENKFKSGRHLALALDETAIYIGGSDNSFTNTSKGDEQWRVEKRSIADGSLITSFGNNGSISSSVQSISQDYVTGLALDENYIYIAGIHIVDNKDWVDSEIRVEKRNISDGSLVTAFGNNGAITSNPSRFDDSVSEIAIMNNKIYIAGIDKVRGNSKERVRIEKRDLTTGRLVSSFGKNGIITQSVGSHIGNSDVIAFNKGALYISSDYSYEKKDKYYYSSIIEKRNIENGKLVKTFGKNGSVACKYDGENSGFYVDNSGLYRISDYQCIIEKRSKKTGKLIKNYRFKKEPGLSANFDFKFNENSIYIAGDRNTSSYSEWVLKKLSR